AALMLEIIAGHDPHDATSSAHAVGTPAATLDLPVRDVRLGLPENYYFDGVTPEARAAVEAAARTLAELGARVQTLRLPDPAPLIDVAGVLARSESSALHARILRYRPPAVGAAAAPRPG